MPERKMQKIAFLVELIVPDDFTIEQTGADLGNSIQFGHPTITFRSQIKNYKEAARVAHRDDVADNKHLNKE